MKQLVRSFLRLACDLCGAERSRLRVFAPGGARIIHLLDERFARRGDGSAQPPTGQLELLEDDFAGSRRPDFEERIASAGFDGASIDTGCLREPSALRELSMRRRGRGLDMELVLWFDRDGGAFGNERAVRAWTLLELFEAILDGRGMTPQAPPRDRFLETSFEPPIIGCSPGIDELKRRLRAVAACDISVLVEGESGTGKEVIARNIHRLSGRRARPLVITNAMELPHSLLQSELFGHVEGAFTGASRDRIGLIESAGGGTFFLDEIGELPLALQATLLRVLQEKEVRRLGESRRRRVDARFVFATNRDLDDLVRRGRFRRDLYFRIAAVRLRVPPLRDRPEDIMPLVEHFLSCCAAQAGFAPPALAARTVRRLLDYGWPGNVRELKNEVERLCALHGRERVIRAELLSPHIDTAAEGNVTGGPSGATIPEAVERLERAMIREALARTGGNRTRSAEALGITRQGLLKKLKRYCMLR